MLKQEFARRVALPREFEPAQIEHKLARVLIRDGASNRIFMQLARQPAHYLDYYCRHILFAALNMLAVSRQS